MLRAVVALAIVAVPITAVPARASHNVAVLTASSYIVPIGTPVTLTARAAFTDDIWIGRYDSSTSAIALNRCYDTVCSATDVSSVPVTHRYSANIPHDSSPSIYVTWVNTTNPSGVPSSECTNEVTDTTVAGTQVRLATSTSSTQIDVCGRVNTLAGGTGGRLEVKLPSDVVDVDSLPTPTTDTADADVCATTAGNMVPFHPLFSTNTGGQNVVIDAYVSTSAIWLCVETNAGSTRLLQPVNLPGTSVLPGFAVNFYPDPA